MIDDDELEEEFYRRMRERRAKNKPPPQSWAERFAAHVTEAQNFLAFLEETKEEDFKDSTLETKVRRMAAQLEVQADRAEVGYAQYEAKVAAAKRLKGG